MAHGPAARKLSAMGKTPQSLIVFHYHLLRGGVRSALERSLAALNRTDWFQNRRLRLVVGRHDGVRSFVRWASDIGITAQVTVDPALDYRDQPWPDRTSFTTATDRVGTRLLALADGPSLFWIHNAPLGKNPLVTESWKRAAEIALARRLPHRFLYQVHDFAECGRLQNLARLRRCWQDGGIQDPYPTCGNLAYAVLNSADQDRLARAGVPTERLFRIPNVINPPSADHRAAPSKRDLTDSLRPFAEQHGYSFHPERPWWLLPIRLIRRKNVLEAVLLSLLVDHPPQLLLTLDANSRQERPYAETVKTLVKQNRLPLVIGFGLDLVGSAFTLAQLFAASDTVVTTSLLEGFGFSFLDGPMQGKPLAGRNLKGVTRDFEPAGFAASRLYELLPVPVARQQRTRLRELGRDFAARTGAALELPRPAMERFGSEVDHIYDREVVDFGLLDLTAQQEILERSSDRDWIREVRSLNPGIPAEIGMDASFPQRITHLFGPETHAGALTDCFHALFALNPNSRPFAPFGDRLLEEFFHPHFQRPLYGGW